MEIANGFDSHHPLHSEGSSGKRLEANRGPGHRSAWRSPKRPLKWSSSLLICAAERNNIVIIMKALPVTVRRIGNSLGVVIPKPVLAQVGLSDQAELTVERNAIVLRKPRKAARTGWAEAAQSLRGHGEDELVMGEFANAADSELEW